MSKRLLLVLLLMLICLNIFAFDGNRKGFLLGFGMGMSSVTFTQKIHGYPESPEENKTGFATDFKIGYAPNNQVEIYYSSQVAWFSITNIYNEDVTISDGVGAFSLSYFLSSKLRDNKWSPSPYLSGGFGFSAWSTPSEEDSDSWTGSGFFLGAGYEFAKHFRVSVNFFKNNPSIGIDGYTFKTNSTAILLTLSAMAF